MIRALTVADLPALAALEAGSQPLPWSDDQLLLELLNDDAVVFGLEVAPPASHEALHEAPPAVHEPLHEAPHEAPHLADARRLVGHACLRRMLDELWVLNIAVHPACRRQGHAEALLVRSMAWGESRGLTSLWLEVREGNAGARALYERLGLTEVGRRPGYYPPVPPATARETAVLMTRSLGPRPQSAPRPG